jgi:hypothetical protein
MSLQNPLLQSDSKALQPGYIWSKCRDKLLNTLTNDIQQHIQVPGAVQFFELTAKCLLELSATVCEDSERLQSVVMVTLTSDLYEVRLQALEFLAKCLGDSSYHDNSAEDVDSDDTGKSSKLDIPSKSCDIVRTNQSIFCELVAMVCGKESYSECLYKVIYRMFNNFSIHS